MEHAGFLSLVPVILAIAVAVATRKVILALFLGVFAGALILARGNPMAATTSFVSDYLVVQMTDSYNAAVLVLLVFIGGFVSLMERSGGALAFARRMTPWLSTPIRVQLAAWAGGVLVFFSDLGTPLIVGPIFEPLVDRLRVSREKLAWILDSTASPVAVLVPITGWAVYIMGLIRKELDARGIEGSDVDLFVAAIPFNLFSILTVLLVPLAVVTGLEPRPMRLAEERARSGERYWPHSRPLRHPSPPEETEAPLSLVWFPLAVLFITLFGILAPEGFPVRQVGGNVFRTALSTAYFFAGISLLSLMTFHRVRSFDEAFALYTDGIAKMVPVASILLLAWSLGAVERELGTASYVIELARARVPALVVPALVFVVGAVMSFATGSSWGSYAILFPLVIPLAESVGLSLPVAVGAVLGGGLFGDHASPISDTTILSSTGAGSDHVDHVATQLPYALAAAGASLLGYLFAAATGSALAVLVSFVAMIIVLRGYVALHRVVS